MNILERVLDRVEKWTEPEPNSGCLIWLKSTNLGRPQMTVQRADGTWAPIIVARVLMDAPEGMVVIPKCGVLRCLNKAHLSVGTASHLRKPVCRFCGIDIPTPVKRIKGFVCTPCNSKRTMDWGKAHRPARLATYQRNRRKLRSELIAAYGGKCVCCGESIPEFLAIDHIKGGGNAHRRSIMKEKNSTQFYRWLKAEGYPKDLFQLACHNCNSAKGFYGKCPHGNL